MGGGRDAKKTWYFKCRGIKVKICVSVYLFLKFDVLFRNFLMSYSETSDAVFGNFDAVYQDGKFWKDLQSY
jgi:hypothetical protein